MLCKIIKKEYTYARILILKICLGEKKTNNVSVHVHKYGHTNTLFISCEWYRKRNKALQVLWNSSVGSAFKSPLPALSEAHFDTRIQLIKMEKHCQ